MKQITPILGNSQKLDGGAMFGNAPKEIWQTWVEVDATNRITLACRAMLIQEANRIILCETGIGAFFEPKLKQRFGVIENEHVLLESLAKLKLSHTAVDIVILSHLHFDHAGGLLTKWEPQQAPTLLFPNAKYLVSSKAFMRAKNPHPRDKASFIPNLTTLLEQSGRLELIDTNTSQLLGADYKFHFSDGHTPGMLLTEVATAKGPIVFAADLIPAIPWVHVPITMGYDRYPEKLIDEKIQLLEYLVSCNGTLFFTHDSNCAMAKVTQDANGKFVPSCVT